MNMALLSLAIALWFGAVGLLPVQQADHVTQAPFPLIQGSHWVYEGTVRWTPPGSTQVFEKLILWEMEIVETLDRRAVVAARVKGHPRDLAWYENGREPTEYLIVQVWQNRYYLLQGERAAEVLKELRTDKPQYAHLVREGELFLEFPLVEGRAFGEASQLTREDRFYCWVVGQGQRNTLPGIKRTSTQPVSIWEITQRTIGGVESFDFGVGVGFTRYRFHHNGTVSDFDLKLVEYGHKH
jgi:hypothetical protein